MVYFDQHIIFPPETQVYIGMLIITLFLLVVAAVFVGIMMYRLSIDIRMQSEMSGVGDRAQARKVEGKKE
jgi:uncharacterized membrane protein